MNSFKSFVKTVADKAQAEFPSPVKASTGATAAAANESAEGKIFLFYIQNRHKSEILTPLVKKSSVSKNQ